MKDYINLFYSILENIETWENSNVEKKNQIMGNYLNISRDIDIIIDFLVKILNQSSNLNLL